MPEKLRIVFMGTPDFAVESLKALLDSGQQVVAVITAPDKPAGRGKKIVSPPVKKYAEQKDISVILQPANLKDHGFIKKLKTLNTDLFVIVAFRMLPEVVWSIPPKGTINLHASLLPDYRGAAPINWAIINGEKETGVTTFFIEKDIDTGQIIFRDKAEITPEMNAGELHDLLMKKGAQLLVKTIKAITNNSYPFISQKELLKGKTLHIAPKLSKMDGKINWNNASENIYNRIRGLSPYPAAWTIINNKTSSFILKLYESRYEIIRHSHQPGTIVSDDSTYLKVSVNDGFIDILNLQLSGKNRMGIKEFLRGFKDIGDYTIIV